MFNLLYFATLASLSMFSAASNNALLCTPPTSSAYASLVASNSAQFHKNFDKGVAGKMANGLLASISMDWTADNEHFMGRKPFVAGLIAVSACCSDLTIHDHIHLNEGNMAAIMYYFQGHNSAPFDGHPASHVKVEAWNGEFLVFDSNALLSQLVTINEFDSFDLQVTGIVNVTSFTNVTLVQNPQKSAAFREKNKNTAAQFNQLFNMRKVSALKSRCTDDVDVQTSSSNDAGFSGVFTLLNRYKTPFPDLLAHDEYFVADGSFVAVESIISGTRTGDFTASNGTIVPGDGNTYRTKIMRWYHFTDGGKVDSIMEVNNPDDLIENMLG